jgi:hypothetical protein
VKGKIKMTDSGLNVYEDDLCLNVTHIENIVGDYSPTGYEVYGLNQEGEVGYEFAEGQEACEELSDVFRVVDGHLSRDHQGGRILLSPPDAIPSIKDIVSSGRITLVSDLSLHPYAGRLRGIIHSGREAFIYRELEREEYVELIKGFSELKDKYHLDLWKKGEIDKGNDILRFIGKETRGSKC